jgi:hypothetical protein
MSSPLSPLEDANGIDVSLIRAKLRLTPAQRVAELVTAVRILQAVRSTAHAGLTSEQRSPDAP